MAPACIFKDLNMTLKFNLHALNFPQRSQMEVLCRKV